MSMETRCGWSLLGQELGAGVWKKEEGWGGVTGVCQVMLVVVKAKSGPRHWDVVGVHVTHRRGCYHNTQPNSQEGKRQQR